jgi:metal-responsive CopG/Arc/MetJ family transcriptional regulator
MTNMDHVSVMSISIDHRTNSAPRVQEILTEHGELILGRFGIHDPREENTGLITVNLRGERRRINNMMDELKGLDGVKVNHMEA